MDVQAQVAGQITSSPTRNGGTKFDVPLSNGMKVTTFDVAIATKAANVGTQAHGEPPKIATFRIEEKPNPRGGPPYRNLIAVALPGEQLPPEIPGAGTPLGATFGGVQPTGIVPSATGSSSYRGGSGGGMSPEDKVRVTKLSCISSAANVFAGSGDVEATLEAAQKIFTAVMQQAAPQAPPAPVAAALPAIDPQAVAAYVAAEAGAAAVQVGAANVPAPLAAEPAAALPWTA